MTLDEVGRRGQTSTKWESVIRPLEAVNAKHYSQGNGMLMLTGPSAAVEWARLRLAGQIQRAVEAVAGRPVNAEFRETRIND